MGKLKEKIYKFLLKTNFLGLEDFYYRKLHKRKFTKLVLDIGSTCNAKCPYCPRYRDGFTFTNNGLMTEEVFDTVFKQIEKIKSLKVISLYAFGEPLLNENAGKYIKKLSTLNKRLSLSTNTTNLNKFTEELMLLAGIQFSIDGWDKESYDSMRKNLKFEETVERLKIFNDAIWQRRNEGMKTPIRTINCLITKNTNIRKFIETWSPYVDCIKFTVMGPYISWSEDKKTTEQYYTEEMKKECFDFNIPVKLSGCLYADNTITLNSNGKVVLCCTDFSQHLELGDYKDLNAAFNSKFLQQLSKKIYLGESCICDGCRLFWSCDKDLVFETHPELKNLEDLSTETCKIKVRL